MSSAALGILAFGAGVVVGAVLLGPASEGSCCERVAAGVRDRVETELGSGVAGVGDLFGIWDRAPGLLDALGVPTDA